MYYEEKFIDGKLMSRSSPHGKWAYKICHLAIIANSVHKLTGEERVRLFDLFCKGCGSDDTNCQCWNDE